MATNQVFLEAIDILAEQDEMAAQLLHMHFPEDQTHLMVAHQHHINEYTVSRIQLRAIESLAGILTAQEMAYRQQKKANH